MKFHWLSIVSALISVACWEWLAAIGDERVELEPSLEGQTVRMSIDGELVAVIQRDRRWPKPFVYPLLRPGWSKEAWTPGPCIVVTDAPIVSDEPTPEPRVIPSTTRISVTEVTFDDEHGMRYRVPEWNGYVAARDVVPESALMVRTIESPPADGEKSPAYDHPHHRGVWLAVDRVNGIRYWHDESQIEPSELQIHDRSVQVTNVWLDLEGVPLLSEVTDWTLTPDRLLVVETTLKNVTSRDVVFGDTKEGFLGVRVADRLKPSAGGVIRDAAGRVGADNVWGRENAWVDYSSGAVRKSNGLTLIDWAKNPRVSRYHVRDYGLLAINPFGPSAYTHGKVPAEPVVVPPGQTVSFRYGLWIHGAVTPKEIDTFVQTFRSKP